MKYVDSHGKPLKLPKTLREFSDSLSRAVGNARIRSQDEVLYLQGKQTSRYSQRNDVVGMTAAQNIGEITNARGDIVHALAEIVMANAKIAYSLMKALEVGK